MDVEVKIGIGVNVTVGVNVGNSGVNVARGVAVSIKPTGAPAIAVCVEPETIVPITAVSREWISWVGAGTLGKAQAREMINKVVTDKRMGVDFRIVPPFGTRQS